MQYLYLNKDCMQKRLFATRFTYIRMNLLVKMIWIISMGTEIFGKNVPDDASIIGKTCMQTRPRPQEKDL